MQQNQKIMKIKSILDTLDLSQIKYNELLDEMSNSDFSSNKKMHIRKFVTNKLNLRAIGKRSKNYWINRGWSENYAYVKSKEYSIKCISVYSRNFWITKINPLTNNLYTIEEADFERNSRRPIRKEYWMKKGHTESDSINLAINCKNNNNKKGAESQNSNIHKITSKRCTEYYTTRGYSIEESKKFVSNNQTMFSKEICINKYGQDAGMKVWQERQIKWKNSLNESGIYLGVSKISLKLFDALAETINNLKYGVNEACISTQNKSYFVDCLSEYNKKIIEFYGDYWHANPNKFSENTKIKTKIAKDIWRADNTRISELNNLDYNVLIIWESEVIKQFDETVKKCINHLT